MSQLTGDGVKIKVTPEILIAKADDVLKDVELIKQCMTTIEEKVNGTKGYWIGEAGELHRKLYNDQKDNITKMMQRLHDHPRNLKQIAGGYTQVEKLVTTTASELTGDVIE